MVICKSRSIRILSCSIGIRNKNNSTHHRSRVFHHHNTLHSSDDETEYESRGNERNNATPLRNRHHQHAKENIRMWYERVMKCSGWTEKICLWQCFDDGFLCRISEYGPTRYGGRQQQRPGRRQGTVKFCINGLKVFALIWILESKCERGLCRTQLWSIS